MGIELAIKSLEELDARKRTINSEANLDRECQLIRELNDKITGLAGKIEDLHTNIKEQHSVLDINCEKLSGSNHVLSRTIEAFELSSKLTRLNRMCLRLDTSPCLKFIASPECSDHLNSGPIVMSSSTNGSSVHKNSLDKNRRYSKEHNVDKSSEDEDEDTEGLIVDKSAVHEIVRELVEDFEQVYTGQLRTLLERREDLPYVRYASIVERANSYLASF